MKVRALAFILPFLVGYVAGAPADPTPCIGCPPCVDGALGNNGGTAACPVTIVVDSLPGTCVLDEVWDCVEDDPCSYAWVANCDGSCCIPQWQDLGGNWNSIPCGVPSQIWNLPCGTNLAFQVPFRVVEMCPLPPRVSLSWFGLALVCLDCD